jgi:hypothetical protein
MFLFFVREHATRTLHELTSTDTQKAGKISARIVTEQCDKSEKIAYNLESRKGRNEKASLDP